MSDRLGPLQGTILLPNQVQCTPIFNTSVYEPVSNNINRSIQREPNIICTLLDPVWSSGGQIGRQKLTINCFHGTHTWRFYGMTGQSIS
jgi:hypothetical protein